jgi:hypothetical protein
MFQKKGPPVGPAAAGPPLPPGRPGIQIAMAAKKKAKKPPVRAVPEYQKIGAQMLAAPGAGKGTAY